MERMIFYSMTEREIDEPRISDLGIEDIKTKGFDSIYLEYRNTRTNFGTPRFMERVRYIIQKAKESGLGVVVNAMPYGTLVHMMLAESPEVFSDAIQPMLIDFSEGQFELQTQGEILHQSVEKCYYIEGLDNKSIKKVLDITDKINKISTHVEGGGCAMTRQSALATNCSKYAVEGFEKGKLLVIQRLSYLYSSLDLSHPKLKEYNSQVLSYFKNEPIDGFIWDEPHFGFAFLNNGRAISNNLYTCFEKMYGYSLKNELIHLWYDVDQAPSSMVRYHYANLLEESLKNYEYDFKLKADEFFQKRNRKDYFLGIHRTMHEETSEDFYIGCVDYFRHNSSTLGGFTDSVFEREDSMLNMFHMARSLASVNPIKTAYNNSWGFKPTEAHHDYYISLLGAMNIRWIGHTYHNSILFGPGYPDSILWDTINIHLKEHEEMLKFLKGANPVTDTAVLYNWASLATFPDAYIHVHRRNLMFLSKFFTYQNIAFQFIDERSLVKAVIEKQELLLNTGRFRRLIIPWMNLLQKDTVQKLHELAKHGIEMIIWGPPMLLNAMGESVIKDFQSLCGIQDLCVQGKRVAIGEQLFYKECVYRLNPVKIQENYESNALSTYTDYFNMYPLQLENGKGIAYDSEHCIGVENGSVKYFGVEVPQYAGLMEQVLKFSDEAKLPENLIVFNYHLENGHAIAGVGKWNQPVTGSFIWQGKKIILNQCKVFCVRKEKEQLIIYGDGVVV